MFHGLIKVADYNFVNEKQTPTKRNYICKHLLVFIVNSVPNETYLVTHLEKKSMLHLN